MNKKIAIVYQYSPLDSLGGGENRLFEIFKRFENSRIDWYCQFSNKKGKIDNINFISLSKFKLKKRSYMETLQWIYLMNKIPVYNYDIIIIGQMPFFNIPLLQNRCKKYKKPFILEYWEYWENYWNKFNPFISMVGKNIENIILKNSSNLVVISKSVYSKIKKNYANKNLIYVPNGINWDYISSLKENNKYDFVYFGRLEKHKRVDRSILVFNQLLEFHKNLKMVIIGEGRERKNLENLVEKLGIGKNIDFVGVLDTNKMLSLVKGSKFFLFFSEQEGGNSLAVLESNACGTPVVHAWSSNGLDKEMFEYKNGLFFKNFDEKFIALKILEILENNDKYTQLMNNAIEFSKQYKWDILVRNYENIINGII